MEKLSITNPFDRAPVYYLSRTDSTMNEAAAVAARGASPGTVVAAGFQSAGRGRFVERKWISAPGEGLLFTLMLDPGMYEKPPLITPLLAGLGVALFVEGKTGRECFLKWPNDVITGGGKVSGILCEYKDNIAYIGIGINCLQSAPDGGSGVSASDSTSAQFQHRLPPVSLKELGAAGVEPLTILEEVLYSLKRAFTSIDPVSEIGAKLFMRNREVTVLTGVPGKQESVHGVLEGLGANGQLLIRQTENDRRREIYSGELSVSEFR